MNQIIPIGKGILIATDHEVDYATYQNFADNWRERVPDVPMILIQGKVTTLPGTDISVFEFTGDVSPTVVAEFQRWWEVVHPVAQGGTISESGGRPPGH